MKTYEVLLKIYHRETILIWPLDTEINPFVPNAPFLYLLKLSENLTVFWCFQGGREKVHCEQMG